MFRRFAIAIIAVSAIAFSGYGQSLSSICLNTSADSILASPSILGGLGLDSSLLDTSFLNKLSVKGSCDSITVFIDTTVGSFKLQLPVAVIKKLNACSLSIKMMLATSDTVINYCQIINVKYPMVLSSANSAGLRAWSQDGFTLIAFAAPSSTAPVSLEVMNLQGTVIRSIATNQKSGLVIWDGNDSRGKQVSAGRYVLVLRAGSLLQSIDIVK